jgi:hypothetical protein
MYIVTQVQKHFHSPPYMTEKKKKSLSNQKLIDTKNVPYEHKMVSCGFVFKPFGFFFHVQADRSSHAIFFITYIQHVYVCMYVCMYM